MSGGDAHLLLSLAPESARWILDGTDCSCFNHVATPVAVVWNGKPLLEHINIATSDLENLFYSILTKNEGQK